MTTPSGTSKGACDTVWKKLILAGVFLGVVLGSTGAGTKAAESAGSLGGYVLQSLEDGAPLDTSSIKGPTLVVFFTPNCPYCKTELRQLDALYASYTLKGWRIMGVAPGWKPRDVYVKALTRALESWEVRNIPFYTDGEPGLFDAFQVRGVPTTVFFDRGGNAVKTFEGLVPEEEMRSALDALTP